jgi:putative hemolysin
MMESLPGPLIFVLILSMALSFLLSGMETGVLALSRLRVRQQQRAGNKRARILHGYLEHPENFLWTILVGNTVTNVAVFSIIAITLHSWMRTELLWLAAVFVVTVLLFYVLCELLPKMLFQLYPNRLCLALAGPFRFIHVALAPLVGLVAWFAEFLLHWTGGKTFTGHLFGTRDELRYVMQESGHGLTSEERAMINRVLDLQSLTVRQVTIPLANVVMVAPPTTVGEVFDLCRERRLSRLPVRDPKTGRVLGIVSLRSLLYEENPDMNKSAGEQMQPALFVNEYLRLEDALRRMQRSGRRLAIVIGREHREIGIVSLEDILKVIFGKVSL